MTFNLSIRWQVPQGLKAIGNKVRFLKMTCHHLKIWAYPKAT